MESEARYRTLFEYAPDGIVIADSESYYLDANTAVCQMFGYTREEFIGLHASDIVHVEELPNIDPALKTIESRSEYNREWQFRRKGRLPVPGEVIATAMPDGNLLGVIRDITERKQSGAVRESYSAIVEFSEDAIVGKDLTGRHYLVESGSRKDVRLYEPGDDRGVDNKDHSGGPERRRTPDPGWDRPGARSWTTSKPFGSRRTVDRLTFQ